MHNPRLQSVIANLGHSGMRSNDPNVLQRVYFTNVYSLLAALSVGIFGTLHLLSRDHTPLGYTELIAAAVFIGNALVLRVTKNTKLAIANFLLTVMAMLVVMLATGGTGGTGIFWLFVFPPVALFLAGKTLGIAWIVCLYVIVMTLWPLAQLNLVTIAYSPSTVLQMLVVLFVVSLGIYAYQRRSETAEEATRTTRRALQEEQSKAEAVLQNIGDGIVASDSRGRVMLMNPAAEDMFGWTFAELVGKQFADLVPTIDNDGKPIPNKDLGFKALLANQKPQHVTMTYQRKNGRNFPATAMVTPIRVGNKTTGLIAAIRDVSREHEVDHAKSEFVTLASHQLRTPISGISWFTEMLLHGDAGEITDEQREYIEQIYSSTQRLATIVDSMLLVSSLEMGALAVNPEPIDLPKLCHKILQAQIHSLQTEKEFTITEHYDPKIKIVTIDSSIIQTIVRNLLSNAIKYTSVGGEITLDVRLAASSPKQISNLVIKVIDTGYGIPRDQQKNVFVKLFRADNARQKDTDGTGLGLYITQGLVRHLGGDITFTSEENKGSTFTVTLPYNKTHHKKGHE